MFMKSIKRYQHIAALLGFSLGGVLTASFAQASGTAATITKVLVTSSANLVYVYPTGGIAGSPACGAGSPYYSFSYSRPMASAYLAALLAAQARGATVEIWGTATCTDQSTSETLDYFRVD
jgi:alpha-beta hydrolase superfamily lysophospholipase